MYPLLGRRCFDRARGTVHAVAPADEWNCSHIVAAASVPRLQPTFFAAQQIHQPFHLVELWTLSLRNGEIEVDGRCEHEKRERRISFRDRRNRQAGGRVAIGETECHPWTGAGDCFRVDDPR